MILFLRYSIVSGMNNMYHSVGSLGCVVYAKVKVHLSGSSRLRVLRARAQRLSS